MAPFLFGYNGNTAALWTSLIMGILIAVLGYFKSYKWAAGMGVITFVSPFILGFSAVTAALWSCLVAGVVVAILAGYEAWFSEEAKPGTTQHGHA